MVSIREVEKRLRERRKKKQNTSFNETVFSMRLSNIFDKNPIDSKQTAKIKKLEQKLLQLGDDPVQVSQTEYHKYEQKFLQKLRNESNFNLLNTQSMSDDVKFVACNRDQIQFLDNLFLEVYRPLLNDSILNESTQLNSKREERAKQNKIEKINKYLQSNVPKIDKNPNEQRVCFLNNNTTFLPSYDSFLPLKVEKTVYDSFALTVYIDRERTGFEDSKDFPIVIGSLIAGRYRVMEYLGAASFAKCIHVKDLKKNIHCCLKIIENNKDFIDQSIDEIKLLR